MAEERDTPTENEPGGTEGDPGSRFPELEELQREIDRRLRDNKRFLENFLADDFAEEDVEGEEGDEELEEL